MPPSKLEYWLCNIGPSEAVSFVELNPLCVYVQAEELAISKLEKPKNLQRQAIGSGKIKPIATIRYMKFCP